MLLSESAIQDDHVAFLGSELHQLTCRASFEHASIYHSQTTPRDRLELPDSLRENLEKVANQYFDCRSDKDHLKTIGRLAVALSDRHRRVLRGRMFRIGVAQKALNLFLKYCGCAGWIPMPPHCPFDGLVMALLRS